MWVVTNLSKRELVHESVANFCRFRTRFVRDRDKIRYPTNRVRMMHSSARSQTTVPQKPGT